MNPESEQELEQRLQQLEAELSPPSPLAGAQPQTSQPTTTTDSQSVELQLQRFIGWFNNLPGFAKVVIVGIAIIVSFAILRAVLKLVAALFSLAILAVVLYFAYQFLVARSQTKD